MVKFKMYKTYLHNYRGSDVQEKKISKNEYKKNVTNVDINKLLNRVKVNNIDKIKKKFILLAASSSIVGLMGIFVFFIK